MKVRCVLKDRIQATGDTQRRIVNILTARRPHSWWKCMYITLGISKCYKYYAAVNLSYRRVYIQ